MISSPCPDGNVMQWITARIRVRKLRHIGAAGMISVLAIALACSGALAEGPSIDPAKLLRIGTVDERFQSYNIEMVEVTGGRFWRPYERKAVSPGTKPDLFAYRPPIDLSNARLRKLAAALAPAYLRVSGTWANTTYFADTDNPPSAAPAGFNGVLTRRQWRGVVGFSRAVDARIVTSFAISPGARDAAGIWTPDQARRLLAYTNSVGGSIAAAEFMNEPDLVAISGAPPGFDAAAYGRDFRLFRAFARQAVPGMMILGPGAVGEGTAVSNLLAASGPGVDVFSYHNYGMLSERCGGKGTSHAALTEHWLSQTDRTLAFNRTLRDRFEPGKPIWLTETAEAACGGNRWAARFLDTFRYLDQLGRLAKAGVAVVMHNTLAASDYGLLDESTLKPRPNYWGALLWRRLIGTTVLDSDIPVQAGLHVYAHCQRDVPGGTTLLVINIDRDASHDLTIAQATQRYTLDAADLEDGVVRLNGATLALTKADDLPRLGGFTTSAGVVMFAPATITFLAVPTAANPACLN
jgi:Glycosyl hydrolase family 79, N-terminal domain